MNAAAVLLALLLSACLSSASDRCGDYICPRTLICAVDRCVSPGQLEACGGLPDGAGCRYAGVEDGVCANFACIGAGCGNGLVEPERNEACDDGNRLSFDGCRSDCRSSERCGDGILDGTLNEECDCGDGSRAVAGCDGPNSDAPGSTCRSDCRPSRCGDGVVDPWEQCDDGNVIAGDGCRADCAGRWTAMYSGTFGSLTSVWGRSPTDVYATGIRMLHWDGADWSDMQAPVPFGAILGGTQTDVYAMYGGTVYRFDGTTWIGLPSPPSPPGATAYWSTGSATSGGVWVIGTATDDQGVSSSVAARWNGQAWDIATIPGPGGARDAWVEPSGDVWVVSPLTRLHNGTWQLESSMPVGRFIEGGSGTDVTTFVYAGNGGVWHFDGVTWSREAGGLELPPNSLRGLGAASGEAIVTGTQGKLLVCDGAACAVSPSNTTADLNAAWVYGPGRAFVVGDNGTILY